MSGDILDLFGETQWEIGDTVFEFDEMPAWDAYDVLDRLRVMIKADDVFVASLNRFLVTISDSVEGKVGDLMAENPDASKLKINLADYIVPIAELLLRLPRPAMKFAMKEMLPYVRFRNPECSMQVVSKVEKLAFSRKHGVKPFHVAAVTINACVVNFMN